jgi:hypothetical protein
VIGLLFYVYDMNIHTDHKSVPRKTDNKAWVSALRDAIDAGDERLYRQKLMQFLGTHEGLSFVETLIQRPNALAVMRRSYRALSPPLGLKHPKDLVAWLLADEATPVEVEENARDVVSMALPYFRFARESARAARKDLSYAIALAMTFFEPVLMLCEPPVKTASQNAAAAETIGLRQAPVANEA